jgi:hypothetical protein
LKANALAAFDVALNCPSSVTLVWAFTVVPVTTSLPPAIFASLMVMFCAYAGAPVAMSAAASSRAEAAPNSLAI